MKRMLDGILACEQMYHLVATPVLSYLWLLKNSDTAGPAQLSARKPFSKISPLTIHTSSPTSILAVPRLHHWNMEFSGNRKIQTCGFVVLVPEWELEKVSHGPKNLGPCSKANFPHLPIAPGVYSFQDRKLGLWSRKSIVAVSGQGSWMASLISEFLRSPA